MGRPVKDYAGQKIGRLLVFDLFGRSKNGALRWRCICDCGKEVIVEGGTLNKDTDKKSCGCYTKERVTAMNYKHGSSFSKTYAAWAAMRQRCLNPNHKFYSAYGGRGITICNEWNSYLEFLQEMGEAPEGFSLDRIDNNKSYSKANCRWASSNTQQNNRRCNVKLAWEGKEYSVKELAARLGIKEALLYYWSKQKYDIQQQYSKLLKENENGICTQI